MNSTEQEKHLVTGNTWINLTKGVLSNINQTQNINSIIPFIRNSKEAKQTYDDRNQ